MDIQALGMLSNITAIVQKQNVNTISGDINVEKDFYGTLREQQINCVKEDIYNKFHIDVGAANGYFECYIPSDVLYRMNTDTVLRQKVYDMLAPGLSIGRVTSLLIQHFVILSLYCRKI